MLLWGFILLGVRALLLLLRRGLTKWREEQVLARVQQRAEETARQHAPQFKAVYTILQEDMEAMATPPWWLKAYDLLAILAAIAAATLLVGAAVLRLGRAESGWLRFPLAYGLCAVAMAALHSVCNPLRDTGCSGIALIALCWPLVAVLKLCAPLSSLVPKDENDEEDTKEDAESNEDGGGEKAPDSDEEKRAERQDRIAEKWQRVRRRRRRR